MKKNLSDGTHYPGTRRSALSRRHPDRLARIDHLFQTFVDDNRLGRSSCAGAT
jgi:hypothetical protein